MPALTLPLTFSNSFWSADYRKGLETLYTKLEQGVAENDEIVAFIRARAVAEYNLTNQLSNPIPTGSHGTGFEADEGASLLMAFRGLQAESMAQGEAHKAAGKELDTLVASRFSEWARGHKNRIAGSRATLVDGLLASYEVSLAEVEQLKQQYIVKVRRADEAEDDAKFAPNSEMDNYTASPRLHPRDSRNPQRTVSVSERIAARFKELQRKATPQGHKPTDSESTTVVFDDKSVTSQPEDEEDTTAPKVDKGKGKAVDDIVTSPKPTFLASPPPMSPLPTNISIQPSPPILLAGLAMTPAAVADLLKRAAAELPVQKVPPMFGFGESKDCFTGEAFAVWLVDNVPGFGGSLDRAEEAAKDLTEREDVVRRIGEFGNTFENNDEAFYQFKPKAFNFEAAHAAKRADQDNVSSPVLSNLAPVADNILKRSNTLVNFVSKAINNQALPLHIRTRNEADAADKSYRVAVRKLDRQRLGLEQQIEGALKSSQKWELDRLNAVKTVLTQYQTVLSNLPGQLGASYERSTTLIASFQPQSDLRALMERYRTGPFTPTAQVYESISHDEEDAYFGIDLRRWADANWGVVRAGHESKERVPEVLDAMLNALTSRYPTLANDSEKRKTWIYEVPLADVHHLRESLNDIPFGLPFPSDMLLKYDAPVIASTVKLWALELDPPLCLWEGWDDFRRIYPTVGAAAKAEDASEAQHIQDVQVALLRLPKVHLLVLQAVFGHIKGLIDTTTVDEDNDVYITKLALSLGRTILRPKRENELSIQDRHPTLLFFDLLKHFDAIIPPTISRKKRDSDRKVPLRKRTAPIDMRVSRSRLSVGVDPREVLEAQLAAKNPGLRATSPIPPVPPLPQAPPAAQNASGPAEETPSVPAHEQPPSTTSEPVPAPAPAPPTGIVYPGPPPPLPVTTGLPAAQNDSGSPPMPTFKEPPIEEPVQSLPMPAFAEPLPEKDDIEPAPMPSFKEPAPEAIAPEDLAAAPPMPPRFASPPPEADGDITVTNDAAPAEPAASTSPIVVSPATPRGSKSPGRSRSPTSSTTSSNGDRSGASLSRSGSGEASRIRGPRGARTQRPQSSNVQSMIAGLNRASSPQSGMSTANASGGLSRSKRSSFGSVTPVNPHDYEPRGKRGGRAQAGAFSRRTMASDAEDEVVQK